MDGHNVILTLSYGLWDTGKSLDPWGSALSGMERGQKQTTGGGAGREVRAFQREKAISTETWYWRRAQKRTGSWRVKQEGEELSLLVLGEGASRGDGDGARETEGQQRRGPGRRGDQIRVGGKGPRAPTDSSLGNGGAGEGGFSARSAGSWGSLVSLGNL